jgi:hypothetical protein
VSQRRADRAAHDELPPGGGRRGASLCARQGEAATRQYGFIKRAHGPLTEGTAVDYVFFLENESFAITNYRLSVETHEAALKAAGFQQVRWREPELSPEITEATERRYWAEFLAHPPVVFLECVK